MLKKHEIPSYNNYDIDNCGILILQPMSAKHTQKINVCITVAEKHY